MTPREATREQATSCVGAAGRGTQLDLGVGMTPLMLTTPSRGIPVRRAFTASAAPQPAAPREARWRHAVEGTHEAHLVPAIDWLTRAQDVNGSGGIARGFAHQHNRYFRLRGWEPDYPETTGYIVPTLLAAADRFGREDLVARALLAATWEASIQLPSGAVQGGVIGEPVSPSAFNTGQVIFGWLAAFERTGDAQYADAARAAARFLIDTLDADGIWRRAHSRFAVAGDALYNARTAWALAEAAGRVELPEARDAAARALHAVSRRQHSSGWLPDCCLTDASQPLLHTIAYTIRGLVEGGRVLGDPRLIAAGALTAAAVAEQVRADGWLSGRYTSEWRAATSWSCLTGQAQMVSSWIRLHEITGDSRWLEPVVPVLDYLKSTQDRFSREPGIAGGIAGSEPVSGGYAPNETLSWATKFFIDALLRHERILSGSVVGADEPLALA